MKTLRSMVMATTIVMIPLGWAPIQAAQAADFTVTRADDPSPGACTPNDQLFGQDGSDTLNTRDAVQGNDLANGGAGTDTCKSDPEDKK